MMRAFNSLIFNVNADKIGFTSAILLVDFHVLSHFVFFHSYFLLHIKKISSGTLFKFCFLKNYIFSYFIMISWEMTNIYLYCFICPYIAAFISAISLCSLDFYLISSYFRLKDSFSYFLLGRTACSKFSVFVFLVMSYFPFILER